MVLGKLDVKMLKCEIGLLLHATYKMKWKWIIGLNIKAETIKLSKENTRIQLFYLRIGSGFQIWYQMHSDGFFNAEYIIRMINGY